MSSGRLESRFLGSRPFHPHTEVPKGCARRRGIRQGGFLIEARGLSKRFGSGPLALDDVGFVVGEGEILCLLGNPGAGKTTLTGMFWSAVKPTRGEALVHGFNAALQPLEVKQAATFITANGAFHSTWTARKNVTFLTRMAGVQLPASRKPIEMSMRRVGVRDRDFDRPMRELAPGVSVLLWLAVAAARDTQAVILDDPTIRLTSHEASDVQDGLLELKQRGKAILLATSDVTLATAVADRIGILRAGRLGAERTRPQWLGQHLTELYVEYMERPHPPGGATHLRTT